MPEFISFKSHEGLVTVESSGKTNLDEIQEAIQEIKYYVENENCRKVIIDVRPQEFELSLLDIYQISEIFSQSISNRIKIAFLVNEQPFKAHLFFHKLTKKNDFEIKVFYAIEPAQKWLRGQIEEFAPLYEKIQFPSQKESKL